MSLLNRRVRKMRRSSGWSTSASADKLYGLARIRYEIKARKERLRSRLRHLLPSDGGLSGRLLTTADLLGEWVATPAGRVVLAVGALTIASLLLGAG